MDESKRRMGTTTRKTGIRIRNIQARPRATVDKMKRKKSLLSAYMRGVKNQRDIRDNMGVSTSRTSMNGPLGGDPRERRLDGK